MTRRSQAQASASSVPTAPATNAELIRKRNGIKTKNKCINDSYIARDQHPLTQITVKSYLIKIDQLVHLNEEIFDKLNLALGEEELEQNNNEFNTIHNSLIRTKDLISTLVVPVNPPQNPPPPNRNNEVDVRLPLIDLPKFSGEIQQWESFHDLFTTLVVNQPRFDNVQKFQYLKVALLGDAAKIIQSIPITNDNFDRAWNAVILRYEDKRSIINTHYKKLIHQIPIDQESPTELRRIIDTTNECIEGLNVRQDIPDKLDYVLVFLTVEKLDPETKKQWELSVANNVLPTYKILNAFLENRARSLFAAGFETNVIPNSKNNKQGKANVLLNNNNNKDCPKCKGQHFINKCPAFQKMNAHDRYAFVKEKSLFIVCLRSGHLAKDCDKNWKCKICNKSHNNLLHFEEESSDDNDNSKVVFTLNKRKQSQVLLATAVVYIADKNDQLQKCRALFDQGAETSLITEGCVNRLGLTRTKNNLEICGVGDSVLKAHGTVELDIISRDQSYSFYMEALVMGKITGLIPRFRCETHEWAHIAGLHLADPEFFEPAHIDILIGAEYIGYLLNSNKIENPLGGPVAQDTKLGWILSGPVDCDNKRVCLASTTNEVEFPFRALCAQLGEPNVMTRENINMLEKRIENNFEFFSPYQKSHIHECIPPDLMELVPVQELDSAMDSSIGECGTILLDKIVEKDDSKNPSSPPIGKQLALNFNTMPVSCYSEIINAGIESFAQPNALELEYNAVSLSNTWQYVTNLFQIFWTPWSRKWKQKK